ncbi:MAG: response regulator [Candidatus Omnitrophica bacterium]|nr:response regulator [Candidatus Omnitrophota bacterium]
MEKLKILVIDDKRIIGDVFDVMVGRKGHEIKYANNYQEAAKFLKATVFDVAFLDIIIPDKDGISILGDIKKDYPTLPVVMMSGYAVDSKKEQARKLGVVTILKKPFDLDDIREAVKLATDKDV